VADGARSGCAVLCSLGGGTDRVNYIVTAEIITTQGVRLARSAHVPVGVV
jgi:hypothetical protein